MVLNQRGGEAASHDIQSHVLLIALGVALAAFAVLGVACSDAKDWDEEIIVELFRPRGVSTGQVRLIIEQAGVRRDEPVEVSFAGCGANRVRIVPRKVDGTYAPITIVASAKDGALSAKTTVSVPQAQSVKLVLRGSEPVSALEPTGDCSPSFATDGGVRDSIAGSDATADAGADDSSTPEDELGDVIDVCVGATHSCAVRANGELYCWGSNTSGELGLFLPGEADRTPFAVHVPLDDVVDVGCGGDFTCAILGKDKEVWCWGFNVHGQLGDGTEDDRTTPQPASALKDAHMLALGDAHACAVVGADRSLYCWGSDLSGQLGISNGFSVATPQKVPGIQGITRVSGSWLHTCASTEDGALRCWGENFNGQLGTGDTEERNTPTLISGLSGASDVSTGMDHTCAMHGDGLMSCWGSNALKQLGQKEARDYTSHQQVTLPEPPSSLARGSGFDHTCIVANSGKVLCWGKAELLGAGPMDLPGGREQPIEADGITNAKRIATNSNHGCAVLDSGGVRCWGYNDWGQVGDGTRDQRSRPVGVRTAP